MPEVAAAAGVESAGMAEIGNSQQQDERTASFDNSGAARVISNTCFIGTVL